MERPSLRRDPKQLKKTHSRWLMRHPENMQNRSERRRMIREQEARLRWESLNKLMGYHKTWRHGGAGHYHYAPNGAFGGRTRELRNAKVKQTCPQKTRAR